jgi:hypothetical protein
VLLTRLPCYSAPERTFRIRLACVRHAASVRSEPGSNSPLDPSFATNLSRLRLTALHSLIALVEPASLLVSKNPRHPLPQAPSRQQCHVPRNTWHCLSHHLENFKMVTFCVFQLLMLIYIPRWFCQAVFYFFSTACSGTHVIMFASSPRHLSRACVLL